MAKIRIERLRYENGLGTVKLPSTNYAPRRILLTIEHEDGWNSDSILIERYQPKRSLMSLLKDDGKVTPGYYEVSPDPVLCPEGRVRASTWADAKAAALKMCEAA